MASKTKKSIRLSPKKPNSMTRANEITIIIICALFVAVGLFLVYRSFAAVAPIK